jgi:hypothetical protein
MLQATLLLGTVVLGLLQITHGYSLEKVPIRKRSPQYTSVDISHQPGNVPGYSSYPSAYPPPLGPSRLPPVGSDVSVSVDHYPDYDLDYEYGYDQFNPPNPYAYDRRPYMKREAKPQEVMLLDETEIRPDFDFVPIHKEEETIHL